MPKQLPRPEYCLNCDEKIAGNFCANCGQKNEDQTVALRLLVSELVTELVSWDSKLVLTLLPLLIRPGFLTNEYNVGRRVRYLSPLKLYLVLSVVFFLIFAWQKLPDGQRPPMPKKEIQQTQTGAKSSSQPNPDGKKVATSAPDIPIGSVYGEKMPDTVEEFDARMRDPKLKEKPPWFAQAFIRSAIKVKNNPQSFAQKLLDNIPRLMFLLLPIFALLLKLIYIRSHRLYIEHLVFSLHWHAFVFLMLTLLMLSPWAPLSIAALLAIPISLFAAMRTVYKQSRLKTLVKFVLLGVAYCFVLTISLTLMSALTLLLL
jgi:hypothetical protein